MSVIADGEPGRFDEHGRKADETRFCPDIFAWSGQPFRAALCLRQGEGDLPGLGQRPSSTAEWPSACRKFLMARA